MSAIGVRRWHTRYLAAQVLPAAQVAAWDASVADIDLHAELAGVGDDEWVCIRRLKLRARLRQGDGRVQAQEALRASLASQLLAALGEPGDNVVRYRDRRDAVADLLYRAAGGDLRRAWAWRQAGLLERRASHESLDRRSMLELAMRQLVAEPISIWPVLTRLLHAEPATGAWTAIAHGLGDGDWDMLLRACPQTRPYATRSADNGDCDTATVLPQTPLGDLLGTWVAAHPWAALQRRRPLAALLAAATQPAGEARATNAPRILAAAATVIDRHIGAELRPARAPMARHDNGERSARGRDAMRARARDERIPEVRESDAVPLREHAAPEQPPTATRNETDGASTPDESLPPAPPLPESAERMVTEWAGLLFLLHLVPATGVIERVAALEPRIEMPVDALQRVLRRIAAHLDVPATDAAVRAFCGGWQLAPGDEGDAGTSGELDGIAAEAASALRALLAARLPEFNDADRAPVEAVCRRPGHIRFEPGWIELRMRHADADPRLRRVALDFDPGWIAWLGCIVRFVYE